MTEQINNLSYITLITTIIPLSVFILSALNFKVRPVKTILKEISASLNDYPLQDLQYSEDCGKKYSNILYTFPGSEKGCSCSEVENYIYDQNGKYEVNPGSCSNNQTSNGCVEIAEVKSHEFKVWGKKKFCSKLYVEPDPSLKGYLYYLNNSVLENEECGEGYQKCGRLDALGNYLCYPKDEKCPINDIQVINKTSYKYYELIRSNYTCIDVGGKEFCYGNSINKTVITKLKIVEGKLCLDKTYFHTDYPQYILDKNFKNYGCRNKIEGKLFENDVEVLDMKTKLNLYDEEPEFNIYSYYGNPNYSYTFFSLEANMTLYPHRYIGYNKTCLNNTDVFDFEKIDRINVLISDIFHINNFTKWLSIISLFLEIVLSTIFNLDYEKNYKYVIVWSILNVFTYGSFAVPITINYFKTKNITEFPLCGDKFVNTKINYYLLSGRKLTFYTKISLFVANIQILFIIGILLFKFCRCKFHINLKHEHLIKNNSQADIDGDKSKQYYENRNYIDTNDEDEKDETKESIIN